MLILNIHRKLAKENKNIPSLFFFLLLYSPAWDLLEKIECQINSHKTAYSHTDGPSIILKKTFNHPPHH